MKKHNQTTPQQARKGLFSPALAYAGLLLCLTSSTFAKPTIISYIATPRSSSASFGVEYLINGAWIDTHPWDDPTIVNDKLDRLYEAGVDVIIQDLTNWQANNNGLALCETEMPVIEARLTSRGMKHAMIIRAQDKPAGANATQYFTSIDMANRHAETIWNDWAQKSTYYKVNNKPLLVIFQPNKATYDAAYAAAPAAQKTYLSKFTVVNCYGGGWGWGYDEASADGKTRYIRPNQQDNTSSDWLQYRRRSTLAEWEDSIKWAMQAENFFVLSSYDETSDGSFWAITDTTGATTAPEARLCNQNTSPSTMKYAYYNLVQSYCRDSFGGAVKQAEGGTLVGCTVASDRPDYTGSGFVPLSGGSGKSIQVNHTVTGAQTASIYVRYASAAGNRACNLIVNGVNRGTYQFSDTGSWNVWRSFSLNNIPLNNGNNTIKLVSTTTAGGPNVDKFEILVN